MKPIQTRELPPRERGQCLCGHFESCDDCRPRRLTRADCEREDAAQALDPSNHPCVQLGDE